MFVQYAVGKEDSSVEHFHRRVGVSTVESRKRDRDYRNRVTPHEQRM